MHLGKKFAFYLVLILLQVVVNFDIRVEPFKTHVHSVYDSVHMWKVRDVYRGISLQAGSLQDYISEELHLAS
jgi:hypothetical protein